MAPARSAATAWARASGAGMGWPWASRTCRRGPHAGQLDRTRLDAEAVVAAGGRLGDVDRGELGQRRGARGQFGEEAVQVRGRALDLDAHAAGLVADRAGQPQARGQFVDERPEADA